MLIDEAAQAEEVAALQPLVYGAQGVVLVGDPQQLPATVFSSEAREVQFERSLFERLQQVRYQDRIGQGTGAGGDHGSGTGWRLRVLWGVQGWVPSPSLCEVHVMHLVQEPTPLA